MKCLERKNYVTYLKVIACILITNSHCREIYPSYFLAIGGGFGNSLFFILSGYCLANIKMPFIEWYKRRLKRLIIPTFFFALLSILYIDGIDSFFEKSVRDIILAYIDKYWFVVAILVYYIVFYYIFKKRDEKIVLNFLLIYLLFYAVWYCVHSNRKYFWIELEGFSLFKVYFYLGIMLVGGYLRLYGDRGGANSILERPISDTLHWLFRCGMGRNLCGSNRFTNCICFAVFHTLFCRYILYIMFDSRYYI